MLMEATDEREKNFLEKVKEIRGSLVEVKSKYIGMDHPIDYKCSVCGETNSVKRAAELITKSNKDRKHNCRKCFWKYKHEKYKEEAKNKALEKVKKFKNITVNSHFRDEKENRLYLNLSCLDCKHEWSVNATSNLRSKWKGCPKCWTKSDFMKKVAEKSFTKTREQKNKVCKEKFFNVLSKRTEIILLGKFIDMKKSIEFKCRHCNEKWTTSPAHVVNDNSGCPYCNSGLTKAKLNYINDVKDIHGDTVEVLGVYKNATTKILHKCNVCEEPWETTPSSIKKGSGCPCCNISRGEKRVYNYLKKLDLSFVQQWTEHNCKHYKKLPFDFYLPEYNLAIEFQGIQHEKFSPPFHKTIEDLNKQKKRDKIKKEYCLENKINFLEIWYHEINDTEKIIDKKLSELHIKR